MTSVDGEQRVAERPNLVLVGFMAAGKTSVGQTLARRLGYDYLDLDELLVARAGCSIPGIFAAEGEAGFRVRERAAVAEAAARSGLVISCGGGVARDPRNVAALRQQGQVVFLKLSAETATHRILADGPGRPMIDEHVPALTYDHVLPRVRELLRDRSPFYEAAADLTVVVDDRPVDDIVSAILAERGTP